MSADEPTELERLEALGPEVEDLAIRIATKAKAFGPDVGARNRIEQVKRKLKVAIEELDAYPYRADDITDE